MKQPRQCQAVALDIPWYVNGTLNEQQMNRVEAHIAACAPCRASVEEELRRARRYSQHTAAMGARLPGPEPSLEALLSNLADAAPPRRRRPAAVAVAAVAVLALSFLLVLVSQRDEPAVEVEYETLTSEPAESSGIVLQVVFREDAWEQQIRQLVSGHGASIVSGPTPKGVYRISLPPGTGEAEADRLLPELRREPAVLMAEREL